jgi:hypothetical protein
MQLPCRHAELSFFRKFHQLSYFRPQKSEHILAFILWTPSGKQPCYILNPNEWKWEEKVEQ